MSPTLARLESPAGRTGAFFFTLFMANAVQNLYLSIWLDDQGLDAVGISTVTALPIVIMIALNFAIGRIADRASDWRQVIVIGACLACIAPVFLFFYQGYWAILILLTLAMLPFQAITPVVDAASVRMSRRLKVDFGLVRSWGTTGFVVATLVSGFLIDAFGAIMFLPLLLATCFFRAILSFRLPLFRSAGVSDRPEAELVKAVMPIHPLVATNVRQIGRPWFIVVLVGAALLNASHMLQMSFGSLLWKMQGVPEAQIGLLRAIAPIGEILVMLLFTRIARHFSARHLLLVSALFIVVRWIGFALEPPLWAYYVLQAMHAATFGLSMMGTVVFIANWTDDTIAAQAQSVFVTIRQIAGATAVIGAGFAVGQFGQQSFYFSAAIGLAGGILIAISLLIMSPKRAGERQREAEA